MDKAHQVILFFLCMFVMTSVVEVQAREKRTPIRLHFAGTLINNAEHFVPLENQTATSAIIHVNAWGHPGGRVLIRGFGGQSNPPGGPCSLGDIENGIEIEITENPLVLTFPDLSLLFANGNGRICADFATGRSEFEIHIDFTGGRGKFEDAGGGAEIRGEAQAVDSRGNFSGETGTLKGVIIRP